MNDTSQGAVSPAAAPPRKPRWGAYRSPEVLQRAGAMVREARKKQGLTLRGVAALTDKSHVFLSEIERGTSALPISLAPRLALVLGMDLAELLCAFRLVPEAAAERFFDVDRMRAALAGGGIRSGSLTSEDVAADGESRMPDLCGLLDDRRKVCTRPLGHRGDCDADPAFHAAALAGGA